jgi:hypothetical protein
METNFEDRSSIKFIQVRVHCQKVRIDGAALSGNTAKLVTKKTKGFLDVMLCSVEVGKTATSVFRMDGQPFLPKRW